MDQDLLGALDASNDMLEESGDFFNSKYTVYRLISIYLNYFPTNKIIY